ncbi:ABC transporter permease [Phaeobacter gallaeciensis]|uniref:ABC transporter permease n=2 Tax=Roseobacteraceae TaxID=2854170 RepID=A0A366WUI4_9RHOB|nr:MULTISPECIES: FtsX-like permease family protein [Roseobacteraceae]MBT3140397.1 FtsX-like permease family protein [Falsiruegeria litorea]MBT8171182.1 FtsX-like permease family protein [Falsiruegeria litorea]RBW51722.1 ABC transporter permease [Phaeobacter gallaeciensis]
MIWPVLSALWSHWRRHPIQLITLLTGLALATGLWSAVQAINTEARASYQRANAQLSFGQLDRLYPTTGSIPLSRYVDLRRNGWQVAAVLTDTLRVSGHSYDVLGVDLLAYPTFPAIAEVSQTVGVAPVDALTAPGRLFMRPETAQNLRKQGSWPPIIETASVPLDTILTDIGVAENLLNRKEQISYLLVLPNQPMNRPSLSQIAPELRRVATQGTDQTTRLTDSFHLNLTAFGLLSFAVGLFIVHGTVGLAFEQRRGMIRTLRALGVPLRLLTRLLLAELLVCAMVGGAIGLGLGYLIAGILLPDVAATLRGLYSAPIEGTLSLRPTWIVAGFGMAICGTLIASFQALWRVSRLPLLAAPGAHAWVSKGVDRPIQAIAGMGLILGGISIFGVLDGLIAGFIMLAGIMMGTALLLPWCLEQVLKFGQGRARSPLSEWVWADMRAQLSGLSLAMMALMLALAANIGVGTMVSSFRLTFTGWLDQRLASELYVTAKDDVQGAKIAMWLSTRSDAVLPIRASKLQFQNKSLFVYGIVDDSTYRDNWPLIAQTPEVWDKVAAGQGVLINEQLARREQIWPGDHITILENWTFSVVGVYSDYGNPTAQAIISLPSLLNHLPDLPNQRFGVRVAPDKAAALANDLITRFDLPAQAVINQAGLKARSMAVFNKTFVVTGALNVLTLGVAGFAILTSMLTMWTQRLPQVAPVWALGITRKQLAKLEIIRSVAFAAMTALLALPLGLVLAWVLLEIINVEAFGWRLPMHLFPTDWLVLGLVALCAASIAAVLPALRLKRVPPSDLLKVFTNDR